jgi:hypothetical protein
MISCSTSSPARPGMMPRSGRCWPSKRDRLVGGPRAALVIDDTVLPKKGMLSVGVERQYCDQLGKQAVARRWSR